MYIGKTDRTLRTRFREYLGEVKSPKGRHKVRLALELWKKYLWFSCAVVPPSQSPSYIEESARDAFIPPVNSIFSAEVKAIVDAF